MNIATDEASDHHAARRAHNLATLREQVEDARAVLRARDTDESRAAALLFSHSLRRVEDAFDGGERVGLLPLHLRRAAAEVVKSGARLSRPPPKEPDMSENWINRTGRGWGLAHLLRYGSEHEWMGASYAKTLCGRRVNVTAVLASGYEDRCQKCAALHSAQPRTAV